MIGNAEISYYRKLAADAAAAEDAAALYNAGYKAGRQGDGRPALTWAGQLESAAADISAIARQMESRLEDLTAAGGEFGGGEFDELTAALAAVKKIDAALIDATYHADNAAHLAERGEPC